MRDEGFLTGFQKELIMRAYLQGKSVSRAGSVPAARWCHTLRTTLAR